jgi:hypothetical protein
VIFDVVGHVGVLHVGGGEKSASTSVEMVVAAIPVKASADINLSCRKKMNRVKRNGVNRVKFFIRLDLGNRGF